VSHEARDALRRYLEQRRELGESEMVLDSMSVDEVLSLVGARSRGPASADATPSLDVAAPADHPGLHGAPAPNATNATSDVAPPSAPEMRRPSAPIDEDAADRGDWRAILRSTGATDEPPRRRNVEAESSAASAAEPESGGEREGLGMAESSAPGAAAAPSGVPDDAAAARHGGGEWDIPDVGAPTGLVVGTPMSELFGGPLDTLGTLDDVARMVAGCTRCPLHRGTKNPVPGEGNPDADLVVVGEAPGAEEDAQGRPFVGASGQLLTKILAAISLAREDVFICNVVKHRPPGNRNPEPDEVTACAPYLVRQIELLRPKVILTLGNFAAQTLLGTKLGISKLRGQVHRYHGIPLVATYHPAALLRNPTWKRPTWEDVQLARRILDRAR
jgi:uracil-DNA glycosylase